MPALRSGRFLGKGKTLKRQEFEIKTDTSEVYTALQPAYRATLVAPLDDMWAAFADLGTHYELLVRGESAGFCSVNEAQEILSFHMLTHFDDLAEECFEFLIKRLQLTAAFPSTVDPSFLSLSLDAGHEPKTKALMFQQLAEPEGTPISDLRLALPDDHPAATVFAEAVTGFPGAFLESYVAERIEKRELFLHEKRTKILASGECREDQRHPGYAHLGFMVDRSHRRQGLGSRLMHALVLESLRRNLRPLCSTEPENLAARRAIHRAGFRARHRVFGVSFNT